MTVMAITKSPKASEVPCQRINHNNMWTDARVVKAGPCSAAASKGNPFDDTW